MNRLTLSIILLFGFWVHQTVFAAGTKEPVYNCGGGAGEFRAFVYVNLLSFQKPGGNKSSYYLARATSSWLGGTHESGWVKVSRKIDKETKAEIYENPKEEFKLEILKKQYIAAGENQSLNRIYVKGTFIDPKTKMKGTVSPRWLPCRVKLGQQP